MAASNKGDFEIKKGIKYVLKEKRGCAKN